MQPIGNGGKAGHVIRMIISVMTMGFVYPNTFVEGMDLTAIQTKTEGLLYEKDKKGDGGKSRF
jgi:hypothetical protein